MDVDFAHSGRRISPSLTAYSDAMSRLTHLHEMYFEDEAASVAEYFLWAASCWHGPSARQLKAELRTALRVHRFCPDR